MSPGGFAWIAKSMGETTRLRVIDPLGLEPEAVREVEFSSIDQLLARTGDDAAAIADGSLWRLDGFARVRVEAPVGDLESASLCGSLTSGGRLLTRDRLFELRDDASWWSLNTNTMTDLSGARIVVRQGECSGPDGALWVVLSDGALWRVQGGSSVRVAEVEGVLDVSATADRVFVLDREWVSTLGPDGSWTSWGVADLGASKLRASTGAVWMHVDGGLLRWRGGQWAALEQISVRALESLHAHEGGVWWSTPDQVCHHADGAQVRLEGVLPFERTRDDSVTVTWDSTEAEEPRFTMSGEELEPIQTSDAAWSLTVELAAVGWHALEVATVSGGRTLYVERLPPLDLSWEAEVEPLYELHCSNCHAGAGALSTDLSTHGSWVDGADRIRAFVVDAQTMPPPASRIDAWDSAAVDTIEQWLSGAMNP